MSHCLENCKLVIAGIALQNFNYHRLLYSTTVQASNNDICLWIPGHPDYQLRSPFAVRLYTLLPTSSRPSEDGCAWAASAGPVAISK